MLKRLIEWWINRNRDTATEDALIRLIAEQMAEAENPTEAHQIASDLIVGKVDWVALLKFHIASPPHSPVFPRSKKEIN
jgi:hypothetical protein